MAWETRYATHVSCGPEAWRFKLNLNFNLHFKLMVQAQ
jgi:hypothetical protein